MNTDTDTDNEVIFDFVPPEVQEELVFDFVPADDEVEE